jgi:hypothetical protein
VGLANHAECAAGFSRNVKDIVLKQFRHGIQGAGIT